MVITVETLRTSPGFLRRRCSKATAASSSTCGRPPVSCRTTSPWCAAAKARPCSPASTRAQVVAMSNPDQQNKPASANGSAMKAFRNEMICGIFSDIGPGLRQPARPEDAHAAHRAGHRVRRRLGDRHAGHRRRRARGIPALHRATGRAQRAGGFAARHQPAGISAAPPLFARPLPTAMCASSRPTSKPSKRSPPRRTLHPARVLPKPSHDIPELYGVRPSYAIIHSLHLAEGTLLRRADDAASATVCVLGEGAKVNLARLRPGARQVRQGERHLAGSGRRSRRATHGRRPEHRRHHAGSQQHRLHPAEHFSVPLLRPEQSA